MVERETFEEHFRNCFEPLTRYAYIYVKDREEAKEIVQEVFISLWEKRRELKVVSGLQVYLYQAVKNKSLNHLRNSKRVVFVSEIPEKRTSHEEDGFTPSLDDIKSHVNLLPARCREIFILKRIQGLSYRQIGLRMNISEKSVENQMTIAFRKLREAMVDLKNSRAQSLNGDV